jgi:hypothetical protein
MVCESIGTFILQLRHSQRKIVPLLEVITCRGLRYVVHSDDFPHAPIGGDKTEL